MFVVLFVALAAIAVVANLRRGSRIFPVRAELKPTGTSHYVWGESTDIEEFEATPDIPHGPVRLPANLERVVRRYESISSHRTND